MSVSAATAAAIGVGVIGFGWLGQAHSRSLARIPMLFGSATYEPRLVACSDAIGERVQDAISSFGFERGSVDWRAVVEDPEVDAVWIAAPNMVHGELVWPRRRRGQGGVLREAGRRDARARACRRGGRAAGVISGVGYNYRWAPLVQYARELIAGGELGEITNYRGRFFSMYGADPLGVNSWRFQLDEGGYGVTSDLLSHAVDLAHMLIGPIARVTGTIDTFIRERPQPDSTAPATTAGAALATRCGRSPTRTTPGCWWSSPTARAARSRRAGRRSAPSQRWPSTPTAPRGAVGWSLERLNELRLYRATVDRGSGYTTVRGGDRFGHHGVFVPGSGNPIGFEDLVTIEDHEFCGAVAEGRPFEPGFEQALEWAAVQDALLRSARTGTWEDVFPLAAEAAA